MQWKPVLFFVIVVIVHILDLNARYSNNGSLGSMLFSSFAMLYLVIALVLAPLLLDEEGFTQAYLSRRFITYLVVSIIAIFLPWLFSLLGDRITDVLNDIVWFKFALIIAPPWGLYVLFTQNAPFLSKVRTIWLLTIILLSIITLMAMVGKLRLPSTGSGGLDINIGQTFLEIWDQIRESLSTIINRLLGIGPSIKLFVNQNLEDSLGEMYQGEVDPYANRELGARFVDIRPYASSIFENERFVVWVDIEGQQFREGIDMKLQCRAKDSKGLYHNGTITAQGRSDGKISIQGWERLTADCEFNGLPKGDYEIIFDGIFVFETWSYVTFYFAPSELVEEARRLGKDPATEAGIPEIPIATYTGGPVALGMGTKYPQPIGIDPVNPLRNLPAIGASLTSDWPDGEVQSVRLITLMTPEPFILKRCDRMDANGNRGTSLSDALIPTTGAIEGYNEYTFGNIDGKDDYIPELMFESVTCYLSFDGESYGNEPTSEQKRHAEDLLGGYDLVARTFAAKTNYVYGISDSIRIEIESLGGRLN